MSTVARREQLLDIALSVVVSDSFVAVTIDCVAKAAGVSRTIIYKHFTSRDGLLQALVERETRRALAGLESITATDSLTSSVAAILDVAVSAPLSWHILLNPPEGGPPALYSDIDNGRNVARRMLRNALGEDGDAALKSHLLHIVGEEAVRLHLRDPEQYPRDRLLRTIAEFSTTPGSGQ